MCGICGLATADPAQTVEPGLLERMTEAVRYRGPDGEGFHRDAGVALGVRRLAINDLETGDQPISNEDGTITLVCNGEIYNFVELRQELRARGHRFRSASDVEVIVHLYEDHGVECLQRLRGMFGFALWDSRRRRLMLARDRLGIKPLHYALLPDGCYFGSELKSILAADRIDRQLDPAALRDLFTLGFPTAPKTLFTSIRRLLPGQYLLYQDGRASLHRYWDLTFPDRSEAAPTNSVASWAETLLDKLRESVRIHLRSDVPLGSWLSPGLDSSAVVSLMRHLGHSPVETYTLGFEDCSADELREHPTLDRYPGYALPNVQAVSTAADFALLPRAIWHSEDAYGGPTLARMLVARPTLGRLKVVLTGEGSDELLGGYTWFRLDQRLRLVTNLPLGLRRFLASLGPLRRRWPQAPRVLLAPRQVGLERYHRFIGSSDPELHQQVASPELQHTLATADDTDGDWCYPADFARWHPFHQLQYLELKVRLHDMVVHTLDRGSMAYSIEARVPFLDHELVELCARIPATLKVRREREKYILREALRGFLPEEIRTRRKRGLHVPSGAWLRGPLPEFARELLSSEALASRGYFRPEPVLQLLEQHRTRRENHTRLLMAVLSLQVWDDLFLRGRTELLASPAEPAASPDLTPLPLG
jgi:asparagine synthase (glutamine-hydrolysing)